MSKRPLTGVIGSPIDHSLSPLIHNHWIQRHGLPGVYAPLHVSPERFEAFLDLAPELGFCGFNVTIPLKTLAFEAIKNRTERAERARSVNTVSIDEDGRMQADSTDGYGFLENLRQGAGLDSVEGMTVAMIGAGGAARAVVSALIDAGAKCVRIANRTRENAEIIAEPFGPRVEVADWPVQDRLFEGADLLVNGTSLGLAAHDDHQWVIPALPSHVIATDMVYAPLDTPFLQAARAAGARTVDGLGMLLHQARPGFARWHGVDPDVTLELREVVMTKKGCLP